ncbi:MAG: hypothetical protein JW712_14400 [Dehalococcoidales bacterium]|nr:hypothetical protein [Dehalococcoidales bacterium]
MIRFWNNDILQNIESVVNEILDTLTLTSPVNGEENVNSREVL